MCLCGFLRFKPFQNEYNNNNSKHPTRFTKNWISNDEMDTLCRNSMRLPIPIIGANEILLAISGRTANKVLIY